MTTTDLQPLHQLPHHAAQALRDKGWIQGTEHDSAGRMCLTGALRICALIPGDGYIAREVFRRRRHAETWNDEPGRTAQEVIDYLAGTEITDGELAETFGPQWRGIVAQVRTVSAATPQQIGKLAAAWDATWAAIRADAADAARDATRAAIRAAAADATWAATWAAADAADATWAAIRADAADAADAARDATRAAAWAARDATWAARDATWALVTRDLIGQHGYTQQHYDLLTEPWRQVFGPLHPDDTTPTEETA